MTDKDGGRSSDIVIISFFYQMHIHYSQELDTIDEVFLQKQPGAYCLSASFDLNPRRHSNEYNGIHHHLPITSFTSYSSLHSSTPSTQSLLHSHKEAKSWDSQPHIQ